jgi:hypothetical protein
VVEPNAIPGHICYGVSYDIVTVIGYDTSTISVSDKVILNSGVEVFTTKTGAIDANVGVDDGVTNINIVIGSIEIAAIIAVDDDILCDSVPIGLGYADALPAIGNNVICDNVVVGISEGDGTGEFICTVVDVVSNDIVVAGIP